MLGGGQHKISIAQIDRDYDWNNLNDDFSNHHNFSSSLSRSYFVVKPNLEMMYRFLPWLALRAEAGYLYGYSYQEGWKTHLLNGQYKTVNSPNTTYEGLTISIGPWFGF